MAEIKEFIPHSKRTNTEVIQLLEEWLVEAKNGEILECALVGVMPNNRSMTAATQANSVSALVGGMEILKARMLARHLSDL
ncbi:hypothetical protein [Methylobacterium fujisawaense]